MAFPVDLNDAIQALADDKSGPSSWRGLTTFSYQLAKALKAVMCEVTPLKRLSQQFLAPGSSHQIKMAFRDCRLVGYYKGWLGCQLEWIGKCVWLTKHMCVSAGTLLERTDMGEHDGGMALTTPCGLWHSFQEWSGLKRSRMNELRMCVAPAFPSLWMSGSMAIFALLHRCQTLACLVFHRYLIPLSPGVGTSGFSVLARDAWAPWFLPL